MNCGLFRGLGALALVVAANLTPSVASADPTDPQIRKLFAANCSWCHDGYGLHGGKGPKLAGTAMSEAQVTDRIKNGKTGSMPGFAKTLSAEDIALLAAYIKGLKDE